MRSIPRAIGIFFLILGCLSAILGVISWPPGGLMFALPYLFFVIAAVFGIVGVLLLLLLRLLKQKQ